MNLYPYITQKTDEPWLIAIPGLPPRHVQRLLYFAQNCERLGCVPPFSRDELAAIYCYLISEARSPEETARFVCQLPLPIFRPKFEVKVPRPQSLGRPRSRRVGTDHPRLF
jgi:hypothetical protein